VKNSMVIKVISFAAFLYLILVPFSVSAEHYQSVLRYYIHHPLLFNIHLKLMPKVN